jgi:hypothetical protein
MQVKLRLAMLVAISIFIAGCSDDGVYTLYHHSPIGDGNFKLIHVASFDSAEGNDYNSENCEIARELFQSQAGVSVKYWCEKGRSKQ